MAKKKKTKWELEYEHKQALYKKGLKGLTPEQLIAVDNLIECAFDVMQSVSETFDVDLGQIRKLNDRAWECQHKFKYETRHKI